MLFLVAALSLLTVLLLADSFRIEGTLKKILSPDEWALDGHSFWTIDDPSRFVFAVKAPWSGHTKVVMTRGFLALFEKDPELWEPAIKAISERSRLGIETWVSIWIHRISRLLPDSILGFYKSESPFSSSVPRAVVWVFCLPLLSMMKLLSSFYAKTPVTLEASPEQDRLSFALRQLADHAQQNPARFPVAFAGLSIVNPWPGSILRLGRTCLFS